MCVYNAVRVRQGEGVRQAGCSRGVHVYNAVRVRQGE